jgi:hypothetical protein
MTVQGGAHQLNIRWLISALHGKTGRYLYHIISLIYLETGFNYLGGPTLQHPKAA